MKTELDKLEFYYDSYHEIMNREFAHIKFKIFELKKIVAQGAISETTAFDTVSMYADECIHSIDEQLSKIDFELFGEYLDGELV